MAQRKKSPGSSGVEILKELGFFGGGVSPFQQAAQTALSQSPESFDYSELDKKYPMRQVTPMLPSYLEQEMEDDRLAQKEALAMQRMREAQASIYESKLNEDIATAEQVQLARQAFSGLNPQDKDYPEKRDKIFMDLPFAENDAAFMRSVVGRNDRMHENYFKKSLASQNLTMKDIGESLKEIAKFEEIKTARGTDYSDAEQQYIDQLKSQVNQFYSNQGKIVGEPVSAVQQPALAPNKIQTNISQKNQEALQWLQQNPTHPSAEGVKAKLQKQGIL